MSNHAATVEKLRALARGNNNPHEAAVATRAADKIAEKYGVNEVVLKEAKTSYEAAKEAVRNPVYAPRTSPKPSQKSYYKNDGYYEDSFDDVFGWSKDIAPPPLWQPEPGPQRAYRAPGGMASPPNSMQGRIAPVQLTAEDFSEALDAVDTEVADLIALLECDDIREGEPLSEFIERARQQRIMRRGWLL